MELERGCNCFVKTKQKINDLIFKFQEKSMHCIFNSQQIYGY
jgi:hypothetical protein